MIEENGHPCQVSVGPCIGVVRPEITWELLLVKHGTEKPTKSINKRCARQPCSLFDKGARLAKGTFKLVALDVPFSLTSPAI
jgi:hypothetical protein